MLHRLFDASFFLHGKLSRWLEARGFAMSIVLAVIFFIIFTTISLHRFWQYSAWYYDFGIFYQAVSSVARGEPPIIDHLTTSNPNKHIFADHFHPLIFIVVPFYLVFKTPETLLVIQTLAVALSGIFLYQVAKQLLRSGFSATLLTLAYYSFFGLHFALITEFHEITLLPLSLSLFFLGMVKRSWWPLIIGTVGVLLTKETTFIIPAWFGLVMAYQYPKKLKWVGASITALSLAYGYTVIRVIIPFFGGEYAYVQGVGVGSTLETLPDLLHPTILKVFTAYGFIPLLAPETLPPVLFNWWSRVQSGGPRISFGMHYNAELAPTLFLGLVIGWQRVRALMQLALKKYSVAVRKFWVETALVTLVGMLVVLNTYVYKSPLLLFFNPAFYAHTKTAAFLDRLLSHLPPEGTVMAQHNLAARLAHRRVFILRDAYKEFSPDYLVFDTRSGQEPNNFFGLSEWEKLIEAITHDPDYQLYYTQGEQFIYQKKSHAPSNQSDD